MEKILATTQIALNEFLLKALPLALREKWAFAIWRNPDEKLINLVIDFSDEVILPPGAELLSCENGFLCAPFYDSDRPRYFIKGGLVVQGTWHGGTTCSIQANTSEAETAFQTIQREKGDSCVLPQKTVHQASSDEGSFKKLVGRAIGEIEKGALRKVVPSRFKTITLPDNYNLVNHFQLLADQYPAGFVSLTHLPDEGLWIGASPEPLIQQNEQGVFRTVALAGTQKVQPGMTIKDAMWRQKEIEEQAMVSRYIINCFKQIRLREFEEDGPKTVQSNQLFHLQTDFKVDTVKTNFPELSEVMLKLLHPTSAVCGTPRNDAMAFLKAHEGYDRGLFAGYLGPVQFQNTTGLFVNIRNMQIIGDQAICYAGAGVTHDSEPEKEWLETEMKIENMLATLPGYGEVG